MLRPVGGEAVNVPSSNDQSLMIFVIGCPGAGKGTLCAILQQTFGWAHISVGDELRKYVQDPSADNDIVACVREGSLIPANDLAFIINKRKKELEGEGVCSFIIDGFPRYLDQLDIVQDAIGKPNIVLHFECPADIARSRVLKRRDPRRETTDTEAVFEQRYQKHQANNPAIVAHFAKANLIETIDTQHDTETSLARLMKVIEDRLLAGK